MSKAENYERYLLKSLIEDLDATTVPEESFENEIGDLSSSSLKEQSPKTSASSFKDVLSETPSRSKSKSKSKNRDSIPHMSFIGTITREDIMVAISNQKSALSLQGTIKEMTSEEIGSVIEELRGSFAKIMTNKNGNYLCSDIFRVANSIQRLSILTEIYESFKLISINEYGTHPIQTLIEQAKTQEEIDVIISAVVSKSFTMLDLAQNPNGSYVLQKIISNIPEGNRNSFNSFFLNCLTNMALNMYGVCIVKKFICFCQNKEIIAHILRVAIQNFFLIAENQYGNYFIQSLLELWWHKKDSCAFKQFVSQCFVRLSKNQFGSHIAESFINMLSMEERNLFLEGLMQNGWYYYLLNDKYGMFVINKLVNSFLKAKRMKD